MHIPKEQVLQSDTKKVQPPQENKSEQSIGFAVETQIDANEHSKKRPPFRLTVYAVSIKMFQIASFRCLWYNDKKERWE